MVIGGRLTMNIEEVRERKKELEARLLSLIGTELEDFKLETNCSPSEVDVEILEITRMGSKVKKYSIGQVITKIEI
jgi:hypothetical protein